MSLQATCVQVGQSEVEFRLSSARASESFWVRSPGTVLTACGESTLAMAIPIACATSEPTRVHGTVPKDLAARTAQILQYYTSMPPSLEMETCEPSFSSGAKTACFFSLGVDSFHSLITRQRDIEHLIIVKGFDLVQPTDEHWCRIIDSASRVAKLFDKQMIEIVTNARTVTDRYCHWASIYHGAAMAAVAHLMRGNHRVTIVPSTPMPNDQKWGSSRYLDPLWSTRNHKIEYYPNGIDRNAKLMTVVNAGFARELRVCTSPTTAFNCGVCEKCIRTWTALYALTGRIDIDLDSGPDPECISKARFKTHTIPWHEETLRLLKGLPCAKRWATLEKALEDRIADARRGSGAEGGALRQGVEIGALHSTKTALPETGTPE